MAGVADKVGFPGSEKGRTSYVGPAPGATGRIRATKSSVDQNGYEMGRLVSVRDGAVGEKDDEAGDAKDSVNGHAQTGRATAAELSQDDSSPAEQGRTQEPSGHATKALRVA